MAVRICGLGIESRGDEIFLNGWNMRFWKFGILENCPGPIFQKPAKNYVLKNLVLPGSKIPLFAIHNNISHVWEDAPRKVNNDEPDLRFFHGNF